MDGKFAELVARWVDEHDEAQPDARTLARLEHKAVLASRPGKQAVRDAEALRAEWVGQARAAGFEPLSTPAPQRRLAGMAAWDGEAVIAEALERVAAASSSWLQADVAREIATLVPADAAPTAASLVSLVDELAAEAAGRCVEWHPPVPDGVPHRRDGRPVTEHLVNRYLTTAAVLGQESRLLAWARSAAGGTPGSQPPEGDDAQEAVAEAVSGHERLVLVVGPAGAGKTTALGVAARVLAAEGRPALGLAPSGKAAYVLAGEMGWAATTLAKLLHEHARPGGPSPSWQPLAGTTVVLDEAAMAATNDLDALVGLVHRQRWRLVCVGDPAQLPAVGRGGMFELWCESVGTHQLDAVRRFDDDWQAEASLALRPGEPAAAGTYAAHHRLDTVHPALVADRVARQLQRLVTKGESVAITTASAGTARAINREIQRRRNRRRASASVALADGT